MPPVIKVEDQFVLAATSDYPYAKWKFEKFNPVQSRCMDFFDKDVNGLIAAMTSGGKAQPDDAIVLTQNGYRQISSLKIGDEVLGGDGKPTRIIGVFPQGKKKIFRVQFSDNSSTECCEDHLWAIRNRSDRSQSKDWRVLSLKEIRQVKSNTYHIPIVEGSDVDFPHRMLGLHPYVLGLILGDGGIAHGTKISGGDPEILDKFKRLLPEGNHLRQESKYDYLILGNGEWNQVVYELSELGVLGLRSYQKFIPWIFKYSSSEQRFALLQGLMDSDGGCNSNKSPTFEVTSKQLAEDMAFLIRSFGGWTKIRLKERSTLHWKGEKRLGRSVYRLTVRLDFNPFSECSSKHFVQSQRKNNFKHPLRKIHSVEEVGEKECRCIKVENEDGLYITNDFIVTHNTVIAEMFLAQEIRKRGGTGMFLAPLRALGREKYVDWTDKSYHFGDVNTSICTGDYRLTKERSKELSEANLIIMTSEMLNHRSRNYKAEQNNWLRKVGTLVIDECLSPNSLIDTNKGLIPIGKIVEENLDVLVASFNHKTNKVEYKKIVKRQQKLLKRKWIALYYHGGNISMTENHMVWCERRGYIASKNIKKGDVIYVRQASKINEERETNLVGDDVGRWVNSEIASREVGSIESSTKCQTEGFCRVEVQRIKKIGWNTAKTFSKRRIREGVVQFQHPVKRCDFGNSFTLLSYRQEIGEHKLAGSDQRSNSIGSVVYGRRQPRSKSNVNSHRRIFKSRSRIVSRLDVQEMGSRLQPLLDQELLGAEIFSGGSRQISGFDSIRSNSRYVLQDITKNGTDILFDVRARVHGGSSKSTHNQEGSIVWGERMPPEMGQDVRKNESLDGTESWCCDLEIEDNNNFFADGVLVHNSHLLTVPGRGDHLEVGLMKFTEINPKARLVLLSATMPNVEEIADWVSYSLTKRDTFMIKSKFRPVPLTIHYEIYDDSAKKYDPIEEEKVNKALEIVESYPDDKFLVFAHTKRTGEMMKQSLRQVGIEAQFHNADLDAKDRATVEDRFRNDPKLRIIVATSTLAWGLNLPARRVIILGVNRGLSEVESHDIIQMVGRSGRLGIDPMGDAYILIPRSREVELRQKLSKPARIESQLLEKVVDSKGGEKHKVLAFHLVSEIHHGDVKTTKDVHDWYKRSLAYFQNKALQETVVDNTLDLLRKCGAISEEIIITADKEEESVWTAKAIGKVSSMFYFSPFDVSDLYFNFKNLFESNKEDNEYNLSMALGNIDSQRSNIASRPERDEMILYQNHIRSILPSAFMNDASIKAGFCYFNLLNGINSQACAATQRNLQFDFNRLSQVLQALDSFAGQWERAGFFKTLEGRIINGVPPHLVDVCRLPNIGKARATKLYNAGFKTVEEIADADPEQIKKILNYKQDALDLLMKDAGIIALT